MDRTPIHNLRLRFQCCNNDLAKRKRHHPTEEKNTRKCDDKLEQSRNTLKSCLISESNSPPNKCRKTCFIIRRREMKRFLSLLDEDPVITDFLLRESCYKISDKYLLAMVFAYFKRAEFTLREYSRMNFFTALYLANDIEEDDEDLKYEIFPWALGSHWQKKYASFLRKKDHLWRKMGYRAVVSRKCCDELMAIESEHAIWSRNRPEYHGGAIRSYTKSEDEFRPRGPYRSPRYCSLCDDEQYSSLDSAWYLSSEESGSDDEGIDDMLDSIHQGNCQRGPLPHFENEWPCAEE